MKSIDLRDLFAGIIDVILIAMALGQYHQLEQADEVATDVPLSKAVKNGRRRCFFERVAAVGFASFRRCLILGKQEDSGQ